MVFLVWRVGAMGCVEIREAGLKRLGHRSNLGYVLAQRGGTGEVECNAFQDSAIAIAVNVLDGGGRLLQLLIAMAQQQRGVKH
jgi:hypothetical protein